MFINRKLFRYVNQILNSILLVSIIDLIMRGLLTIILLMMSIIAQLLLLNRSFYFFDNYFMYIICIVICIVFRFLLSDFKFNGAIKYSLIIKRKTRENLLKKLFDLGPAYTHIKRTGTLVTTIWSRVEWLNNYYQLYLPTALSVTAHTIIICAFVYLVDWVTGILLFVICCSIILLPIIFYNFLEKAGEKEWKENAKYYSDCLDGIQGLITLKSINANEIQLNKIFKQGELVRKSIMSHLTLTIIENVALEFVASVGLLLITVISIYRYINGNLLEESALLLLFLTVACFKPLYNLIAVWNIGYRGIIAEISIDKILNEVSNQCINSTMENNKKNLDEDDLKSTIIFDTVSFAYPNSEINAISNVSFELERNTVTALVGISGSGKSTLAYLLSGFYMVDEGEIRVNQMPICKSNVNLVQDLISTVWQDAHIFYGSFYDNILMGNPNAKRSEVIQAAKDANIHTFIENQKDGYNTILGERGMKLSGGQRQRVAIARAFLRNTPILIFDEATSSLDRKNEKEIQVSFEKLSQNKTVLVIAHRLETIKNADKICVVESGKVKCIGTHQELVESSEEYRCLVGEA